MRKTTKTMALFAMLSLAATGCQKENVEGFADEASVSEAGAVYTVLYSINGVQHRNVLHSEDEYRAFLHELMELAKQGYEVVFCNGNTLATNVATKETLYFSTTDQQAATEWLDLRVKEG